MWRASALSNPGPAWNDEEAAANRRSALVSWKRANNVPFPAEVLATSAISVLSFAGIPTRSRTARTAIATVSDPSIANVSQSVMRPNRSRP